MPSTRLSTDRLKAPTFEAVFGRLLLSLGPRNWWPGETPFEILVGAVLTQSVAWRNVEMAISRLKGKVPLTAHALWDLGEEGVADLITSTRFPRRKAGRLFALLGALRGEGLPGLLSRPLEEARERLLHVKGVGEETADCILLYGGGYPLFVVDAYTRRLFARLGHSFRKDDEIRQAVQAELPEPLALAEFHAQIVAIGNRYCRPKPVCRPCPLRPICPMGFEAHQDPPEGTLA